MGGKHFLKYAAALVLAFAVALTPAAIPPANAATSLKSLQDKQAELSKQQKDLTEKLEALRQDKAKQQEYKETLETQMKSVQDEVAVLNQKITVLDTNIKEKSTQIEDKQVNINKNYDQLKGRLLALYKMGEASTLEIVLSSKSVMDLADKTKMVQTITDHDTKLISTLKTQMLEIADEKKQIEADRTEVAEDKTELDKKRLNLAQLEEETEQLIAQIEMNEDSVEDQRAQVEAAERQAGAEIDQRMKEYYAAQAAARKKAAEEAAKRAANGGSGGSSNSGGSSSGGTAIAPETYVGGQFTWPVPGFTHISCGYSGSHRALDINRSNGRSIAGAPIVAANSGTVIVAQFHYSYGNYVMIDHGGGYTTLYAHASSLAVSKGQQVNKGQTIAYVGSTGNSTGPHLHFEMRVNGDRQNPFNWFKAA